MLGKRKRGFSIIELMIAVAIVSLLFAFAVPSFSGWVQNQQIRTAAESILNGIQLARGEAVRNNTRARFVLCDMGTHSSSWEVLVVSAAAPAPVTSLVCAAGSDAAAGEARVQERSGQEGSRMAVVNVTPAGVGAKAVTFNSFGRVAPNADGTATITAVAITGTGDRPLNVSIGTAGSIRMCDPSPLLKAADPRRC